MIRDIDPADVQYPITYQLVIYQDHTDIMAEPGGYVIPAQEMADLLERLAQHMREKYLG